MLPAPTNSVFTGRVGLLLETALDMIVAVVARERAIERAGAQFQLCHWLQNVGVLTGVGKTQLVLAFTHAHHRT
jgi:hypothetical protein